MARTLWITGVAGLSGRHLVRHVASEPLPPRVVGFDIVDRPTLPLDDYHRVNISEPADVARIAADDPPDWVIHLAAPPVLSEASVLWDACVAGTLGLALGILRAGCTHTRLLGIGSAAEYRPVGAVALSEDCALQPSTSYGRVKLAQTLLTLSLPSRLGLSACVARTFNLVGPALSTRLVVGRLCDEFSRLRNPGDGITVRHLESTRDFVDVRDAVAAYWMLVQRGTSGEVYNVCSGIPVSLSHVVELLSTATGKHPAVHTTEPRRQSVDPDIVYGSFSKLQHAINWSPKIELAESIADMLAYITANDQPGRQSVGH